MITFHILYTGKGAGYQSWSTGTIHPDGTISGTWFASDGQSGTWESTDGNAKKYLRNFGNWLGGPSIVTTSSLCWFDMDPSSPDTREFRLIFTPDMLKGANFYKLSASNPGQFYYNVFYVGTLATNDEFEIKLPYPFVTQGANPVHVYSSLNIGPCGCLTVDPASEITGDFTITPSEIDLSSSYDAFGEVATITVKYTSLGYDGFVYVTVHMDYDLKGTNSYNKNYSDDALHLTSTGAIDYTILNGNDYTFNVDYPGSYAYDTYDEVIYNLNVFKKFAGFMGEITDSDGDPVVNQRVDIKIGTKWYNVYTDEDGYYMLAYKHTGKAIAYEVRLNSNSGTKIGEGSLKANGYVECNYKYPP
jgi:hypothetical protein